MYIKYGNDGLIPVVAQDNSSGEVLMVAYMNEAALNKTIETGLVHYYSRTRRSLWLKGETSGHFQHVVDIMVDCDQDTLLVKVNQDGCACHTGNKTCFYRKIDSDISSSSAMVKEDSESYQSAVAASAADSNVLNEVFKIINDRKASPREGSYTTLLFQKGLDKILKKIGEESAEVIIAAKNRNNDEIRCETADLIYHLMVMMADAGLAWEDIFAELKSRN